MPLPSAPFSPSLFLLARTEKLRQNTWAQAFGAAWLTLLGCALLRLVLPAPLRQALRPLLAVAPLLPLAAKDLAHLPDALARTRTARAAGAWWRLPAAWLPPEFVGLIRLDAALRRGVVGWLLRRRPPLPPLPPGQAFGYLERGAYGTVVAIAFVCALVEMPLDALIASFFVHDQEKRMLMHVAMAAAALSSLAWVVGDRWWIGAGRHVLDEQALHLRVGARTTGTIARAAIAGCARLDGPAAAWCQTHGIDPRAMLVASPIDKPNVVLTLMPGAGVRLRHMGRERADLVCVFLYVDRPESLVDALREH